MKYRFPMKQPRSPRFSHHDQHHHPLWVLWALCVWFVVWGIWGMFALCWWAGVSVYLIYKWLFVGAYKGGKALLVAGIAV